MILMSTDEIQTEMNYRYAERLGLLCLDGIPSEEEKAMAGVDSNGWVRRFEAARQATADTPI